MGNTVTNNNSNGDGTGVIVLGIVAITAIAGIIAVIVAALTIILVGVTATTTAILGYKCYQLRVQKTIALAAIQAGMQPPPFNAERRLPTARELMVGRDSNV